MTRWFVTIIVVLIATLSGCYAGTWLFEAILQRFGFFTSAFSAYVISFIALWLAFFNIPSSLSDDARSKLSWFISTAAFGALGVIFILGFLMGFSVASAAFVVLQTEASFPEQFFVIWILGILYLLFFIYVGARVDKEVG